MSSLNAQNGIELLNAFEGEIRYVLPSFGPRKSIRSDERKYWEEISNIDTRLMLAGGSPMDEPLRRMKMGFGSIAQKRMQTMPDESEECLHVLSGLLELCAVTRKLLNRCVCKDTQKKTAYNPDFQFVRQMKRTDIEYQPSISRSNPQVSPMEADSYPKDRFLFPSDLQRMIFADSEYEVGFGRVVEEDSGDPAGYLIGRFHQRMRDVTKMGVAPSFDVDVDVQSIGMKEKFRETGAAEMLASDLFIVMRDMKKFGQYAGKLVDRIEESHPKRVP